MEVDLLIYAKQLITMAEYEKEMQRNKVVAVNDGKIFDIYDDDRDSVWPTKKLKYEAKETLGEREWLLVMPGMINTHGHCPMRTYRGQMPDGIPFEEVLFKYMFPLERANIDEQQVSLDTALAINEMRAGGVTTTAEMYYYTKSMAREFRKKNMRAILGETIMSNGTYPFPKIKEAYKYLERIASESDDLVQFAVAPHAPYTVNDKDLKRCVKLAKKFDMHLLMHMSETKAEIKKMVYEGRKKKRQPMMYLEDLRFFEHDKITLAHCIYVTKYEMEVLQRHNVGVAFNAVCNALLGLDVARIPLMREMGINVGLATDGPLTNDRLDLLSQLNNAMTLIRSSSKDSTSVTCYDMVRMATIEAAKSLHLEDKIGSIEIGKQADIVALDSNNTRASTYLFHNDPYQYLVKNSRVSDVKHVLVNGKP